MIITIFYRHNAPRYTKDNARSVPINRMEIRTRLLYIGILTITFYYLKSSLRINNCAYQQQYAG